MTAVISDATRRIRQVTGAFMWLGITETIAYPLTLLLNNIIRPMAIPIIYLYVSRLVEDGPTVGFDYYTFVIIGFATNAAMSGTLTGFGRSVDSAIQQGRFETFLVQPISWYTLPYALAAWPVVESLVIATVVASAGLAFGGNIDFGQLPMALLILAIGLAASHAIGTLAASVRLLSKRADPVVSLYSLAASIFSGALFPVEMLPSWIRPIAYVLPDTYVISGVRRLLMPQSDSITGPSLGLSIAALSIGAVVLGVVSLFAFIRSLDFGRRYGILGGY